MPESGSVKGDFVFRNIFLSFPLFSLYNVLVIVIQKEGSLCNLFKKVYLTKKRKKERN